MTELSAKQVRIEALREALRDVTALALSSAPSGHLVAIQDAAKQALAVDDSRERSIS